MLTFGQLMLAIATAILGLVVLPLLLLMMAGTSLVDLYEYHSWQSRRRRKGIAALA